MNTNLTERQSNIFMFITLWKELEKYAWTIKGVVNHQAKQKLNNAIVSNNALSKELEKMLGSEAMESFENDSEVWSSVMGLIRQLPVDQKKNLIELLMGYSNGEVKIINE